MMRSKGFDIFPYQGFLKPGESIDIVINFTGDIHKTESSKIFVKALPIDYD